MLNIGILGCGRIGQVHAASLSQISGARLVAVSDALPHAAQTLAHQYDAKALSSEALLRDPGIDAVVIGTPTDTHFDLIREAASNGKAILCEKPVDLSVTRIRECLEFCDDAGVPFMTAFNRRFDPNFANLENQLRDQVIGNVELVTILSRDPSPPPISYIKSSGGIFRDMMIHDLDMARFLLDEDPVELYATGSCLIDPEIGAVGDVDTAAVTLKTASGKICQISNSRRATYGYDQRIEVRIEIANETGFNRAPAMPFFLKRYATAYVAELRNFVETIQAGKPTIPSGLDGLKAQALADAADASRLDGLSKKISY